MKELKDFDPVVEQCKKLLAEIACDFVAVALQDEKGPDIRWHYAVGNANEKYRLITVRFGKGIAGKVISSGSPIMIEDFANPAFGKTLEQPIMLAENLISSYAVPLFFTSVPKGVLLVGNRQKHVYSEMEKKKVKATADDVEKILSLHFSLGGL